jgi:hypothetical protein
VTTIRALLLEAHVANCQVGCATCPGNEAADEVEVDRVEFLIAAE